ncbi:MAG: hypothetical protein ABEH56_07415 [Salinirussus sp.]
MCYESLLNGEAAERPIVELLRAELPGALKDGTVAALAVVAVLAASATPPVLIAGAALGAVLLGVALHQAVLVAGTGLVRWRVSRTRSTTDDSGTSRMASLPPRQS